MTDLLVVEDDDQLRKALTLTLRSRGYVVHPAANGAEALAGVASVRLDVVVLDLGLPDMDGVTVIERIRETSGVPIVVLSARRDQSDKVTALDAGADDYLTKPFGFAELLARMRAALRRAARVDAPEESVLVQGPLRIDLGRRRVELGGEEVHLTPIEFRLLSVLARHAGRVVTHKQLLTEVWGPQSAEETQYLRVYLTHLRRKLEPDPSRGRIFHNEAGVGYRLELASPPEPSP